MVKLKDLISELQKDFKKGLSRKKGQKYGSVDAMEREVEKYQGTDNYKQDWDADYKVNKETGKKERIKTKKGAATKAYEKMFGKKKDESLEENKALRNKSKESGIDYGTLKKVYDRGLAAWNSGHSPGTPQAAWAMGRVNSFITGKGGARKADKDLWQGRKKVKKEYAAMNSVEDYEDKSKPKKKK